MRAKRKFPKRSAIAAASRPAAGPASSIAACALCEGGEAPSLVTRENFGDFYFTVLTAKLAEAPLDDPLVRVNYSGVASMWLDNACESPDAAEYYVLLAVRSRFGAHPDHAFPMG